MEGNIPIHKKGLFFCMVGITRMHKIRFAPRNETMIEYHNVCWYYVGESKRFVFVSESWCEMVFVHLN